MKYIPKTFDNETFERFFQKFGEVDFGYVVKNPRTKQSRGFGYITFKDTQVAKDIAKIGTISLDRTRKLKIFEYKRRGAKNQETAGQDQTSKNRNTHYFQDSQPNPYRMDKNEKFNKHHHTPQIRSNKSSSGSRQGERGDNAY